MTDDVGMQAIGTELERGVLKPSTGECLRNDILDSMYHSRGMMSKERVMRRLITPLILSIECIGMLLISQAALAANFVHGAGCFQKGNHQGNDDYCSPGAPNLPESHFAVLLPIIAIVLACSVIGMLYLRQRARLRGAE
jgi:hypothetical protein